MKKRTFRFAVTGRGETLEQWLDFARKAEELGYSTLAIGDHIERFMAPLVTLAAVAHATKNLRLAAQVLVNDFRHPAVLAKEAASADVMTGGRFELGIGAGSTVRDNELAGIHVDPAGVRIERTAEAVRILKAFFMQESVSFDGSYYRVRGLTPYPRPLQRPHMPLMIGANGPRTLHLAARDADIISILTEASAGSRASGRMSDKIALVRQAAGPRYEDCEIHTWYTRVEVDGKPDLSGTPIGAMSGLVGSRHQVVEELVRQRDENDVSYVTVNGAAIDAFAPIVRDLAGT